MVVDSPGSLRRKSSFAHEQLFMRAAGGDLASLDHYIASGGRIDAMDEEGLALIHYAACHGDISLIRKLREHGADMNLPDDGSPSWKPVHYAIFHRKHEVEQELRKLGAEVPLPILKQIISEIPVSQKSGIWATEAERAPTAWCER